ncbi:MAG: glutamine-hydrolyzing carbamoyl-phosphate synthase small subunit [Gammaproteobacteria bacterium]|nr:glutamine-hydrolyzing carbamoyl-phosphate synthase small subunit [Gammaproteobacteria bacterium]
MTRADLAILAVADGSLFHGTSIGAAGAAVGEVVFNTAMTGYQEILTDPSYARQIVTLTYPHIGNTGTNPEDVESGRVWAEGLVIRDLPLRTSSWRAAASLPEFLRDRGVVAIAGIDTRRLTRLIREKGALGGCILAGPDADEGEALRRARAFPGLEGMDLAQVVSRSDTAAWGEGVWSPESGYSPAPAAARSVVAYDFGIKHNILRLLADRGCAVTLVPAKTPAEEVLAMEPDGVFLSNGPGDPDPCDYAIDAIREIVSRNVPVFGICLGHQLLALASGAKTVKMPHGHHGANHPVRDLHTGQVIITSQNHGFAVDETSLPECLETTHVSLFDGTVQGLRRKDRPAFGFQGHPEASPGPRDCVGLFDAFVRLMEGNGAREQGNSEASRRPSEVPQGSPP